ncbi:Bax inhibitor-1/YccA family protein [Ligilactobacillus salivarius]|jgi:FtsH-binding integral membrane protein|nr:Bax inhibitor-1/YccA family protein [Ligilactobacillus salivarius]MBM6707649.1 Bax inhibitor-1/YccA family protein [Ligilactobacillus salivarius]MDE1497984.1 Bax inhibitor-1/YccA family protein [Ligilactobacillus salivarius]MDE1500001.1 Bax inhibitor-1/YccA family protein [Ligilactobacillus salivarius]MDE1523348.1 Bax inhibitor-1/YccA family protein [Ligilactobacillus salivarius]MDE1541999.1 Bax inhibitor-1/YccA family protein [Ligilactobacillus salivarius]
MNNNEIYGNQAGLNSFMTKMYGFMAGAVAISAVTAYLISNVYQVQALTFFANNRWAVWGILILQVVLVMSMSFKADRSPAMSLTGLGLYSVLEGLFFGLIVQVYSSQDVTMAFVSATVMFTVLALMGTNTKKDLSGIGRQAMAALIALIIVMIINIFLRSSIITLAFSFIGVVIFAALIAWDSQRFRQMYIQYGNQINTTNLAIMGALQLYLDFVNLFIQLLNIFTGLGGNKD